MRAASRARGASNFNSIKVRLEPKISINSKIITQFQFHKGTIRTDTTVLSAILSSLFQFHKGTIRTYVLCNEKSFSLISIP